MASASMAPSVALGDPVPFVLTRDDGSLEINKAVTDYLKTISDKKVTVVSIVGQARKGKSFLLGTLTGSASTAFQLGHTFHAATKGIWISVKPHPKDASRLLVLLDTEGMGDPLEGDDTHDSWIFVIVLLLSSAFVYNNMGPLNQQALDYLRLAAEMTNKIKTKNTDEDESGEDFAQIFPELIFVLRDFFLELKDPKSGDVCDPNEYLESCLELKKGYSDKIEQSNRLKRRLRDFFPKRSCFVFPRPVSDDENMKILDKLAEAELNPRFLAASKLFTDYVLESAKNKSIAGLEISASFFASLAEQYVEAVQTKFVCIEAAINMVKAEANQRAMDEALEVFEQELSKIDLPLSPERLRETVKPLYDGAREHYLARVFGLGQEDVNGLLLSLEKKMAHFEKENGERCVQFCSDVIKGLYDPIEAGLDEGEYMKSGGYKALVKRVNDMRCIYKADKRIKELGASAESVLEKFVERKVRPIAQVVLVSDESLTQKEKEMEAERQSNERAKRQAEQEMKERDEQMARMHALHRQKLEDEKRIRQEQDDVGLAMMMSMREHYQKLNQDTQRLIREGHKQETEALHEKIKNLEEKISDLQANNEKKEFCIVQ